MRLEPGVRSKRWRRCARALTASSETYWADRTGEQILAVSAWIALAEGAKDKAVTDMRRAADGEDASVKDIAMENRLYPLRELLGDLLLEAGQPQAAMREYATALVNTPNRYRGLYGAAVAAQTAGDRRRRRTTSRSWRRWPRTPTPRGQSWRGRGRFSRNAESKRVAWAIVK